MPLPTQRWVCRCFLHCYKLDTKCFLSVKLWVFAKSVNLLYKSIFKLSQCYIILSFLVSRNIFINVLLDCFNVIPICLNSFSYIFIISVHTSTKIIECYIESIKLSIIILNENKIAEELTQRQGLIVTEVTEGFFSFIVSFLGDNNL